MTSNAKRTPIASRRSSARRRGPFPQAIGAHDSMSPAKASRTNRPGPQLSERSDADETQPTVVARPRTQRGRARNHVNGLGSGSRYRRTLRTERRPWSRRRQPVQTDRTEPPRWSRQRQPVQRPRTEPRQWFRQRQQVQTDLAHGSDVNGLASGSRYRRTHGTTSIILAAAACPKGPCTEQHRSS